MLRRNPATASNLEQDSLSSMRAEIERAFAPSDDEPSLRRLGASLKAEGLDIPRSDVEPVEAQKPDRRSLESLRAEIQRAIVTSERGTADPAAGKSGWRIPPSRIALLVVALLAGGLAAFLATRDTTQQPVTEPAPQTVTQVVQEPKAQILVAKGPIGIGQRLTAETVEWADWPEGALRPEFVTIANSPEAITEMTGAVARFEFFPGEPIRTEKLAHAEQGYLSAVLESGMRGVSVKVSAESASGGFIVPNDRVDVLLTQAGTAGQVSDTILHNVRVLAINTRLGETGTTGAPKDEEDPRAEIFAGEAMATLELDPSQAEVIVNATTIGKLSLVLRPIVDTAEAGKIEERTTNQAIRISSPFWKN
ncbi:MAG: Flp pilus assembly protein CpaB [Devosia sp.]|uniref:Flp pilus assembly protein CpaB n=1 Tax=Devosia sp. TaxID=1871048 RepID=UPI002623EB78|nr:Flp pilus assembly protein CpaB [Devosia sp.]MDB5538519.1 Flp pilus assembly protein CpaB [Devosia sp.]